MAALIMMAASFSGLAAQHCTRQCATKEAVAARVAAFADAFVAADTTVLAAMLTEAYVHTNADGAVHNKQTWLAWLAQRRARLESRLLVVERYVTHSIVIAVYGDAAVVTGINESVVVDEGRRMAGRLRFTHLWVLEEGRWQRAAFHDARLSAHASGP